MKSDTFANRYKIIETIGRGGMGVVYKAIDLLLDKTVALKVLSEKISDQAALRFQAEAKAAGMLNHPNIVMVLDFGVNEEGAPYMVMEYIKGTSLADLLKPRGLAPLKRSLEILEQTCRALVQAHERGIIHRDIKPSNVIVATTEGGEPLAKLTDFGVAKLIERDQGLTTAGSIIGSPLYMSPEQVRNEVLDARSDIYSLGCLMYETLCGRPPLQGKTQLETARMSQDVKPQALSTVTDHKIPAELDAIVAKCLEKDKGNRYQNVGELVEELNHVSRSLDAPAFSLDAPASSPGQSSPGRPDIHRNAPTGSRRLMNATVLVIPVLVLIAVGVFYFSNAFQSTPDPVAANKTSPDLRVSAFDPVEPMAGYGEKEVAEKIDAKIDPRTEIDKEPNLIELTNRGTIAQLYNATPAGLTTFAKTYRGVEELEIFGGATFDGTNLRALAPLSKMEYLTMTDTPLRDEKLKELAALKQLTRIKFEYIDTIKGSGLLSLANLKLQDLSYMKSPVTEEIISYLAKTSASRVAFKGCRGLNTACMSELRKMPNLKWLVLDNTRLTDDMLKPLAGLKLKEIRLGQNTGLTRACFSTIKPMNTLEDIGFSSCTNIPVEDRIALAKEMDLIYDSEREHLYKRVRKRTSNN